MTQLNQTTLIAGLLLGLATTALAEDAPKPIPFPPVKQGGGMNHMGQMEQMDHGNYDHGMHVAEIVGDLEITGFYSRETLPNAPVAGGFMTITNSGKTDDRLIAASSDIAERVEIHEMAMENDVMRMRELPDGLSIPAGATVELKPGGFHIMFMDLNTGLSQGDTVTVTLEFEQAGETTLTMPVAPRQGAMGGMGGAMGHGGQHGHQMHGG